MIGPPVSEIVLELQSMHPVSVFSESLSPDSVAEEEEERFYTIETTCSCGNATRFMVQASQQSLRSLQVLLLQDLKVICFLCEQIVREHGRR